MLHTPFSKYNVCDQHRTLCETTMWLDANVCEHNDGFISDKIHKGFLFY